MKRTFLAALMLCCGLAGAAAAQHAPPTYAPEPVVPVVRAGAHAGPTAADPAHPQPAPPSAAPRLVAAGQGWLIGTGLGLLVGHYVVPHRTGGEDPGVSETIWGGLVGGAAGAALGAGLPRRGDTCRSGDRLLRAFAGAGAGGAISAVLIAATDEPVLAVTVPFTTIGGALLGARSCRPTAP